MDRNLFQQPKTRIVKGGAQIEICLNCHMAMHPRQAMHDLHDCVVALSQTLSHMQERIRTNVEQATPRRVSEWVSHEWVSHDSSRK